MSVGKLITYNETTIKEEAMTSCYDWHEISTSKYVEGERKTWLFPVKCMLNTEKQNQTKKAFPTMNVKRRT